MTEDVIRFHKEMNDALIADHHNNEKKKPAMKRFIILPKIDTFLRKKQVQEIFVEQDGCLRLLADWLKPMPDKSYPNQKIVKIILECIDRLKIDSDLLAERENDIETAIK